MFVYLFSYLLETTSEVVQFRERRSGWVSSTMDKFVEKHASEQVICTMQIRLVITKISHEG